MGGECPHVELVQGNVHHLHTNHNITVPKLEQTCLLDMGTDFFSGKTCQSNKMQTFPTDAKTKFVQL